MKQMKRNFGDKVRPCVCKIRVPMPVRNGYVESLSQAQREEFWNDAIDHTVRTLTDRSNRNDPLAPIVPMFSGHGSLRRDAVRHLDPTYVHAIPNAERAFVTLDLFAGPYDESPLTYWLYRMSSKSACHWFDIHRKKFIVRPRDHDKDICVVDEMQPGERRGIMFAALLQIIYDASDARSRQDRFEKLVEAVALRLKTKVTCPVVTKTSRSGLGPSALAAEGEDGEVRPRKPSPEDQVRWNNANAALFDRSLGPVMVARASLRALSAQAYIKSDIRPNEDRAAFYLWLAWLRAHEHPEIAKCLELLKVFGGHGEVDPKNETPPSDFPELFCPYVNSPIRDNYSLESIEMPKLAWNYSKEESKRVQRVVLNAIALGVLFADYLLDPLNAQLIGLQNGGSGIDVSTYASVYSRMATTMSGAGQENQTNDLARDNVERRLVQLFFEHMGNQRNGNEGDGRETIRRIQASKARWRNPMPFDPHAARELHLRS